MRVVDADYLEQERAIAQAAVAGDADGVHAALAAAGYLPDPRAFEPERVLAQIRTAGEWYFTPGFKRLSPGYIAELMERSSSPRSDFYEEMRQETVPPQALLIRRMEGLVLAVLGELRAGGRLGRARRGVLRRRAAVDAARGAGRRVLDERTLARRARSRHRLAPAMRRTLRSPSLAARRPRPRRRRRDPQHRHPEALRQADRPRPRAQRRAGAAAVHDALGLPPPLPRRPRRRQGLALRHRRRARLPPGDRLLHRRVPRGRSGERPSGGHRIDAPARAHRPLPPALLRRLLLAGRASSGASAARSTRSRRRSPGASSCGWPPRPSATARADAFTARSVGERRVRGDHAAHAASRSASGGKRPASSSMTRPCAEAHTAPRPLLLATPPARGRSRPPRAPRDDRRRRSASPPSSSARTTADARADPAAARRCARTSAASFAEGRADRERAGASTSPPRASCNQAHGVLHRRVHEAVRGRQAERAPHRSACNRGAHRATSSAMSCGALLLRPPSIEWRERNARYSIQAKVRPSASSMRMANSAIRNGPRLP